MNRLLRKRFNILSLYLIGVSLIGLSLLAAFTFSIPILKVNLSLQKLVVGSIFGSICLLGIIAGVYPTRCSRVLHFQTKSESGRVYGAERESIREKTVTFEGHHPDCGNFSAHVFWMGGKTYCAGCTGLVIGAVISFFGTLVYVFTQPSLGGLGIVFFWLGFTEVALGLLQYTFFNVKRSSLHLFLNVIFILGAFLLLVGIEEITGNLVLEVYFVALTLFWIMTRILLSQQEHRKLCAACGLESCSFHE